MSHASNIEIPARFSFRPYSARWTVAWAKIIGWWEQPTPFGLQPIVQPRGGDKVLVRVDVADNDRGVAGMLYGSAPSCTVEIHRADVPADVLQPHENRRNAPDIAGREFVVLACRKPEFETFSPALKPEGIKKDAWEMRDEFLSLENETAALTRFLNRWGLWSHERGYDVGFRQELPGFVLAFPHLLWERRDHYRRALTRNPRAWLASANHLSFTPINEPPYFLVERFYCEDAIKATVTIDHLANVKFGICKLEDCRKLFKRTSKQRRTYCKPQHAHLANVRKLREDARKTKKKAATKKGS